VGSVALTVKEVVRVLPATREATLGRPGAEVSGPGNAVPFPSGLLVALPCPRGRPKSEWSTPQPDVRSCLRTRQVGVHSWIHGHRLRQVPELTLTGPVVGDRRRGLGIPQGRNGAGALDVCAVVGVNASRTAGTGANVPCPRTGRPLSRQPRDGYEFLARVPVIDDLALEPLVREPSMIHNYHL
jgi:hypothetical protein